MDMVSFLYPVVSSMGLGFQGVSLKTPGKEPICEFSTGGYMPLLYAEIKGKGHFPAVQNG